MLLTQLEYFVAVARERHFGRAAAVSFVSASALSESIRKLETELGVPLVRRGRAYEGLTPEGEAVLVWAQRMLADHRALRDEVGVAAGRLNATVRLGVIPSGVAIATELVTELSRAHPLVRARITTGMTSEQIVAGLRRFELDAGLIHPSASTEGDLLVTHVRHERLVAVTAGGSVDPEPIEGAELVRLPLCLLQPGMRARRVIDDALAAHGLEARPRVEADSVEALLALARTGSWTAVVPISALPGGGESADLRVIELIRPEITLPLALARLAEEPRSPLSSALDKALDTLLQDTDRRT